MVWCDVVICCGGADVSCCSVVVCCGGVLVCCCSVM